MNFFPLFTYAPIKDSIYGYNRHICLNGYMANTRIRIRVKLTRILIRIRSPRKKQDLYLDPT